jgi:hypothetical protein
MALNCEGIFYLILNLVAHVDLKRFVQKICFHEACTGVCVIVKQTDRSLSFIFQQKLLVFVYVNTDVCINVNKNDYNGSPFPCSSTLL